MERDENIFKTLSTYKKLLEEKGYKVIYLALYGSQNYNLDDENSDIDAKAIVIPSLHDIIFRKSISKTVETPTGNIDVKDLMTFYEVIKKGNFGYVESIQTKFSIGDKFIKELFSACPVNLQGVLGAMHEKYKALDHPYPSKEQELERWGFDPKQFHHILRLYDLLEHNVRNADNRGYLTYDLDSHIRKNLLDIKRNKNDLDKESVQEGSRQAIETAKLLLPKTYKYEPINLDEEVNAYIEKEVKKELIAVAPTVSAREVRTFDNPIPQSDLKKFPVLQEYVGKDVSYIVYESIDIL